MSAGVDLTLKAVKREELDSSYKGMSLINLHSIAVYL